MSTDESLIKLHQTQKRAQAIWDAPLYPKATSKLLGSSKLDKSGTDYWKYITYPSFVAPNFHIDSESPIRINSLNCAIIGSDRDDRPLYYFFFNGAYAISSNDGLLFVAGSTIEFFEAIITYGEWVEVILSSYGSNGMIEAKFTSDDINTLEANLLSLFNGNFNNSFWSTEINRLRTNAVNSNKQSLD